jgi:hypothetical protein
MGRSLFPSMRREGYEPPKGTTPDSVIRTLSMDGVAFAAQSGRADWPFTPLSMGTDGELTSFLSQLEEQGLAFYDDGEICLTWQQVFHVENSADYGTSYSLMRLPPRSDLRPCLASDGSFSDPGFSIYVSGWVKRDGSLIAENPNLVGALIKTAQQEAILSQSVWQTMTAVEAFHRRKSEFRSAESNRASWGEIRKHAKAARADLTHFLESTIVLTPDKLTIRLRKTDVGGGKVVEVIPNFDGQPLGWLETFDRFNQIRDRYEVAHGEGLTHVVITPEVSTVLREIKRMPGRRVVGDHAEAFVRNPFAVLGPAAESVIDPEQFDKAREEAGIGFARFTAQVEHDPSGSVANVGLLVEEAAESVVSSEYLPFAGPEHLERFVVKIQGRIDREAQCCAWEGNDLEILGDTPDQVEILRQALREWRLPGAFKASEIFDLSQYSERIEGFGLEKPYFSPFIARKSEGSGWFPENIIFGLQYTPDGSDVPIAISFSEETFMQFSSELQRAKNEERSSFTFPGLPKPVEVRHAEAMLALFEQTEAEVDTHTFHPEKEPTHTPPKRKGLIVKANVDKVDYQEFRGSLALALEALPSLPKSLRQGVSLKDHQLVGVGWLQHLWSLSPTACRGALLADDMGLGKTIQLLTFIAYCLEMNSDIDPFLIVAPVSLLENWKEEIDKFFEAGTLPILTLYGPTLRQKRMPQRAIEEELLNAGVGRLLARDWLGDAKVVLTTYETLRDLEFSLARQKWSVMVCDEAQKIKTPNAMVSRAAKKQNARFKIACTGTPVENTLTDLWCLFDFIQPGLLGALTDFGNKYRRPIEAETDEEKVRVEELRTLIEPQKLRRTKAEVAKDLPHKIVDPECGSLPISARQRALYAQAVTIFRNGETTSRTNSLSSHLGLLSYLRTLCSDPRPPGPISPNLQALVELEQDSPKMAWALKQLVLIKQRAEKVIVFCEFKELQRTLQRAIAERVGFVADIVNGDTSAASERTDNRQKRIKAFQETPGFGVIILSPLAVGFGVNIQAANHVIHFTRTWNPAREDQATDRAYRIGQTKDVYVYYPVVVAQDFVTFDAKLDELLEIKRKLSQDMLNGCGDVGSSDFADLEYVVGGMVFDSKPAN